MQVVVKVILKLYVFQIYPPQGNHSRRDAGWHQSTHFLWQHLQHLQLVLACEGCPVIASRNGLSSWLPLLPYLEANSTGANGLFQLPEVVGFFSTVFMAGMVPAVSVQNHVPEQHVPHT